MTTLRGAIMLGSYVFQAYDVDVKPHQADHELFESYEGLISIKKKLEQHTEVTFKVLLSETMLKNFKRGDDVEKYRTEFVKYRRSFLDELDGQILLCVSDMFPPFQGIISTKKYKIDAGYTEAEYEFTVKETH